MASPTEQAPKVGGWCGAGTKTDLIDQDALALRALTVHQDSVELADYKDGADPESTNDDGWPLLHISWRGRPQFRARGPA